MRDINLLVIHCADTPNGKHFTTEDIDEWHHDRGFLRGTERAINPNRSHIGYHYAIYIDGTVHTGRGVEEPGAHAEGYNKNSLGISLIGRDRFTRAQWVALEKLVSFLQAEFPSITRIIGHYQVDTKGKTCPNFDVPAWVKTRTPMQEDIYPA